MKEKSDKFSDLVNRDFEKEIFELDRKIHNIEKICDRMYYCLGYANGVTIMLAIEGKSIILILSLFIIESIAYFLINKFAIRRQVDYEVERIRTKADFNFAKSVGMASDTLETLVKERHENQT